MRSSRHTTAALFATLAFGCNLSGLIEPGALCAGADPNVGRNCGTCGVVVCSEGALACVERPTARRDLRVDGVPAVVEAAGIGDLELFVRIGEAGDVQLEPEAGGFVGCLPNLNTVRSASGDLAYVSSGIDLATVRFGPLSLEPGRQTLVDPKAWPSTLPDDDGDGAKNLFELLLGDAALAADPAHVPAGFSSEVVDVRPNPRALSLFVGQPGPVRPGPIPLAVSAATRLGLRVVSVSGSGDVVEVSTWRDDLESDRVEMPCRPTFVEANAIDTLIGCGAELYRVANDGPDPAERIVIPGGLVAEAAAVLSQTSFLLMVRGGRDRALYALGTAGASELATVENLEQVLDVTTNDNRVFVLDTLGVIRWLEPPTYELVAAASVGGSTPLAVEALAAAGDTLWVAVDEPASILVFRTETEPRPALVPVATLMRDRPARGLFADPISRTWLYALDEEGFERINRYTLEVEARVDYGDVVATRVLQGLRFMDDGSALTTWSTRHAVVRIGHDAEVVTSSLADARRTFEVPAGATRVVGLVRREDAMGETFRASYGVEALLERIRWTVEQPSILVSRTSGLAQVGFGPLRPTDVALTTLDFSEPYRRDPPSALEVEPGTHELGLGMIGAGIVPFVMDCVPLPSDLPVEALAAEPDRASAPHVLAPLRITSSVDGDRPGPETVDHRYDTEPPVFAEGIEAFFRVQVSGIVLLYLDWSDAENAGAIGDLALYVMGDDPGEVLHKSTITASGNRHALVVRVPEDDDLLIGVSAEDRLTPEMSFELVVLPWPELALR